MQQFRIWDKLSESYLENECFFINSIGEILFIGLFQTKHLDNRNYIVQKSTGLLDLYSNELFEGDLVELYYHHANITANRYEIKYSMGRWMLDEERCLTQFWFDNSKFGDVCRVVKVGNTFQKQ